MENESKFGNIENINSKEILKQILSFISNFQKLDLFKYSNHNQKKFCLNLVDYKNESQKERKIEKNNICEEYILGTDIKIFEGEFFIMIMEN